MAKKKRRGKIIFPKTFFICAFILLFSLYANAQNAQELNTWDTMANAPGNVSGGALVYPGSGDTIYAFRGNSQKTFWAYSISQNKWDTMTNAPESVEWGALAAYPGSGDTIYALRGDTNNFWAYSISQDKWDTTVANAPESVRGNVLVYPGSGDTIYAFRGFGTKTFWAYSISNDTWVTMANATENVDWGGTLVYPGSGDTIYAFRGIASTTFWAYSISNDTWVTMANAPASVAAGSSLVYPGSGDTIYAFRGFGTNNFWAYSISQNKWDTTVANAPAGINNGGALVYPSKGGFIYAFRGDTRNNFWRYSLPVETTQIAPSVLNVAEIANAPDTASGVNPPRNTGADSYVEIRFFAGDTTAGVLADATDTAGANADYACTITLIESADSAFIPIWTNQVGADTEPSIRVFAALRTDTPSLDTNNLPTGITNTANGLDAFNATIIGLKFADVGGNLIGDSVSKTDIGDTFAYTIVYYLSQATASKFNDIGIDTAAGSTAFTFWVADTYGGVWTQNNNVTVTVDTASAPWSIKVIVKGLTQDLHGGLGGAASSSSSSSGGGGGGCVIENLTRRTGTLSLINPLRRIRDIMMETSAGRKLVDKYYEIQ